MSRESQRVSRDEAIRQAGFALAMARVAVAGMTAREQAEAAWSPTCGLSVDELEDRIRVRRGLVVEARETESP